MWDLPGLLVPEESVAGNGQSSERSLVQNLLGFFFFLFSHHYSKLNKKGRAMRKGSYWDPAASPHKLGISLRLF